VPTTAAICGVKPNHSGLKRTETYEKSVTSYRSLSIGNLVADKGIQMGEMSKLVWLIGFVKHAIWVYFLSFLYLRLLSVPEILASYQLHPLRRHFGLIFIFLEDPL
jgi:hypothetical protein